MEEKLPKILVVEDNKQTQTVMTLMLRKDYQVTCAADGETAIQYALQERYDIVLMDINLEGEMDGLEVLAALRRHDTYLKVPVIAVTAYAFSGADIQFREAGFNAFINKPFRKEQLLDAIKALLFVDHPLAVSDTASLDDANLEAIGDAPLFRILSYVNELSDADLIQKELENSDCRIHHTRVCTWESYLKALKQDLDIVLCAFKVLDVEVFNAIDVLQKRQIDVPLVVIMEEHDNHEIRKILKAGAVDCIVRDHLGRLSTTIRRAIEEKRNFQLSQTLKNKVVEHTNKVTELNQALATAFHVSIQIMAKLAELHSPVLGNHAKRVAGWAKLVGRNIGMTNDELFQLEVAAILHDIGKVGIDPRILGDASAKRNAKELATFMTHSLKGSAMIKMMPNFEMAALYVRHHHENYNGTGFPDKLCGEDIPIGSRIIAVASAFDNELNLRHAFLKKSLDVAIDYLRSNAGILLDSDIVNALVRCVKKSKNGLRPDMEVEISLQDLRIGMVLSSDLSTLHGKLLLPRDSKLKKEDLERLFKHNESDPIVDGIHVYRNPSAVVEKV